MTVDVRAEALLTELAGPGATFRPHQLEAVRDLVDEHARVLCVQRTGWGKSAVYFLATRLLRDEGAGPALIVSPLLALMRNQIAAAQRLGIRAHTINSTNRAAWDEVRQLLADDAVDLLLISPERLNNPQFRETMLPLFAERVGLLVVDEAHCISDWGHDFRPDYRRLAEMLERLPEGVAVLATTATANDRVVADVEEQLRTGHAAAPLRTYRGPLARSSLRLEVVELAAQADRLAWLADLAAAARGLGDRLHAHQARRRRGRRVAHRARRARGGLQRRGGGGAADRRGGAAAGQRAQGRRGDERARHGLRQARPRVRRALPGAGLRHRLLPAGRARGSRGRARRRGAAPGRGGPADPGLLHRAGVPAARRRGAGARGARGRGRGRDDRAGAQRHREPRPRAAGGDAQGARRRGRGGALGEPRGWRCRARTGPTTASATRR